MPENLDIYVDRIETVADSDHYVLSRLLKGLDDSGLSYRFRESVDGRDLAPRAFVHIDLTELPQRFHQIDKLYPQVINGQAVSIDRRRYSRAMLERGSDYAGPVISKSIYNHRGVPEFNYQRRRNLSARVGHLFNKLIKPHYKQLRCPHYEVHETLAAVPDSVWTNPEQIVERFLPGSLELPIEKHRYNFFYDYEFTTRSTFESLLCNPDKVVEVDEAEGRVPDEVRNVREMLHLDYGSIDYFMVDDKAYVIDANKTTTTGDSWIDAYPVIAEYMRCMQQKMIEFVKG
ncbi:hypothetical protein BOW53_12300 [Solemya pervernicosa gill symbiont]|uniref:ATP-grasp domain-containing protein n=1 Tax=Solemya pervernicosa gill symbiont TaxID=642797 RepID=A0A1T2L2P8_9GAMM|nr:hypothetical protein [Solemya pervernicosa gill symbiont]OOZ39236.1 hypothetical protein BOW53_12300 [Solemya pervernicosa gill symbiont]